MKKLLLLLLLINCAADAQVSFTQKIIGQRRDKFIGSNWVGQDSITWQYNAAGDSINKTSNQFSSGAWNPLQNNLYFYNSTNGLQNKYIRQSWISGAWQNGTQFLNTYDANNNEVLFEKQVWVSNSWQPSQKITKTFSATNKLLEEQLYTYANNTYTPYNKSVYTYDASDLVEKIENSIYNAANSTFTKIQKREYGWTFSGKPAVYQEFNWNATIGQYQYTKLIYYYYDAADNLVDVLASKDSTLLRDYKITSHYTATNLVDTITIYKGDTNSIIKWNATNQHTYNYNADATVNELKLFKANGFSWLLDSSAVYNYNANKNITQIKHQKLLSNVLEEVQLTSYIYNANNNKTYYLLQDKAGVSYVNNAQAFYYYNTNPLKIIDQLNNNLVVNAYPNPCINILHIACAGIGDGTIHIYNSNGQLCQSTQVVFANNTIDVPVANLSSGNYFIQIQNKQSVFTAKFAKQ